MFSTLKSGQYTTKKAMSFFCLFVCLLLLMNFSQCPVNKAAAVGKTTIETVANTVSGIRLNYSVVASAKGYYIYRREASGSYQRIATVTNSSVTSYTDSAPVSGTIYYYCIKAYNSAGVSEVSNTVSILFLQPVKAENLTLSATNAKTVKVSWTKVKGATAYNVYRKSGTNPYKRIGEVKGGDTTTYTDKEVVSGTSYTYAVRAKAGSYIGSYSGKSIIYLDPVTSLTLTNKLAKSVQVSWSVIKGAKGYIVYRKDAGGAYKRIAEISGGTTTSFIDIAVESGKSYTYAVRAQSGSCLGGYTGITHIYLDPVTASDIKLTNPTGSVKISWKAINGADGYIVYRRTEGGSYKRITVLSGASSVNYTDRKIASGTKYYYAIRAKNGSYLGNYSGKSITYHACKGSPADYYSEEEMNAAKKKLSTMTLEEKILQMFLITPEALIQTGSAVTQAGTTVKNYLTKYPVGGIVFSTQNLNNPTQTASMLKNFSTYASSISSLPIFLSVTEEGGTVTRIAKNSSFGVTNVGNMCDITTASKAKSAGTTIGGYLYKLGFNLDYAPVADVMTNSKNTIVAKRSFGSDPDKTASLTQSLLDGLHSQNVYGTLKHFPGHGSTTEDSHLGAAVSYQTKEQLNAADLVPYFSTIEKGAQFIMVGHISLPNVSDDGLPATLSKEIMTDLLRNELGYEGIIITDSMNMGAITKNYSSARAAVMAVKAGADIILTPEDFVASYQGILQAVKNKEISENRINESVKRILLVKGRMS